ncbi:GDYXXLXY domain-containing protein [Dolichospermum sp. UHCC 0259]|uniref:GDYXXLXY domain-containing protein n=1 Tax=Dolichospermum sp. UHCC 0259 TaxID=2590010 RepID=UPI001444B948|nr:GDYXXLXY domain-containing protein [Dolichospermum sp. UHCC 0259]MTJ49299.1 GDYXXLXY domain-containing protein [Dolichospermum sp. UHCC 0259]
MKNDFPESKKTLNPEMEFSEKLTFRDYLKATEQKANKPLPIWRLIAPLLVQVGLILAVPSQAMYTDVTGKTVILQTVPVNSNDVVRGSSLNLDYNISRPETLRRLPGWNDWLRRNSRRGRQIAQGSILYLVLQERQSFDSEGRSRNRNELLSWRPIRVSSNRPVYLSNNQAALKGNYQDGLINYGLENYFIPEEQRQQINEDISQIQETRNGRQQPILVRVKVDPQGNAIPTGLSIRDANGERGYRNYRFQ